MFGALLRTKSRALQCYFGRGEQRRDKAQSPLARTDTCESDGWERG